MTPAQISQPVVNSSRSVRGILNLSLALLAISFAPIFIRFSQIELGSNATVFNRSLIFLFVFGFGQNIFVSVSSNTSESIKKKPSQGDIILLIMMGGVSLITLGLWTHSLQYITVAKSMVLTNITPLFTALGGWLFLQERFDYKFLLGMTIALLGVISLSSEDLQGTSSYLIGDLCAILSALFRASYFLIVQKLRANFNGNTILIWRCITTCLLLLPILTITGSQIFPISVTVWLAVIGLGIVCEGIGQRLLADSLELFSSSFVALFLLLEPIISAFLAWLIFGEQLNYLSGISFICILSGIYLAQFSRSATNS